jgi:hypothetical protein
VKKGKIKGKFKFSRKAGISCYFSKNKRVKGGNPMAGLVGDAGIVGFCTR